MKLFGGLYARAIAWSKHPHAPWYLGGVSFAESSFFPLPPDIMLAPMALARPDRWFFLATLTTLASVAGGLLGYFIGFWAIDWIEPHILASKYADTYHMARDWFMRWGFWAILLAGLIPVPYKIFTITAGALTMNLPLFILASILSRAKRFFLVAWLMARFGPSIEARMVRYIEWMGWGLVAVVVVAYLLMRD
ncbi:MAG: YqaA family protein [Pseudomonadota bacterium]